MTLIDTIARRIAAGPSPEAMASSGLSLSIHVLDTLGAWIAGRATSEGRQLYALRAGTGVTPPLFDSSDLDTVALCTASARLTEVDDIHMASCTTPGALVVMTALTLAASLPRESHTQDRFVEALHVGYEVMTCLGEAVSGPQILHQGIWPSLLLAPITAAAVTSKLLNLDAEPTAHALAIALTSSNGRPGGSASAGVASARGTSARWLLFGMAARSGCAAAISAAAGFTGDRGLLENDQASPMRGIAISHETIENLLQGRAAFTNTSIKPYCSAKHNIAAIYGFRLLLDRGFAHESLSKIRVRLPTLHANMVGHYKVEISRLSRITSCAYNVALMAVQPDALLDIERSEPLRSAELMRLAAKIEAVSDEQLNADHQQSFPAAIDLFQGEQLIASETVRHAWGDPELPFQLADAKQKFRRLSRGLLKESTSLEIQSLCIDLVDNPGAVVSLAAQLTSIDRQQAKRDF